MSDLLRYFPASSLPAGYDAWRTAVPPWYEEDDEEPPEEEDEEWLAYEETRTDGEP